MKRIVIGLSLFFIGTAGLDSENATVFAVFVLMVLAGLGLMAWWVHTDGGRYIW